MKDFQFKKYGIVYEVINLKTDYSQIIDDYILVDTIFTKSLAQHSLNIVVCVRVNSKGVFREAIRFDETVSCNVYNIYLDQDKDEWLQELKTAEEKLSIV